MNKTIRTILQYTWELPQTLLGEVVLMIGRFYAAKWQTTDYKDVRLHRSAIRWGVSLGRHIILGNNYSDETIKHEYGHTRQSLFLGPVYLLVVGLPSITMNIISQISYKYGKGEFSRNYYNRWPENWADKLGGVER